MTGAKFAELFGGPPRQPESRLEQRHMDLAASVQRVAEEVVLKTARHAWERTGRPKNLVMAGGVALNCVANGRLLREGPFENLWIQPASGDAGGALGAALFVWHQILGKPRTGRSPRPPEGILAGPVATPTARSGGFSIASGHGTTHHADEAALLDQVADGDGRRPRSSAGSTAAPSTARARWAPAASSATRATPGCRAT